MLRIKQDIISYFCGIDRAWSYTSILQVYISGPALAQISGVYQERSKRSGTRSYSRGSSETNLTSNHEDTSSIPGLTQWDKDPALLWLWCRLGAVALIRPLAWELPYAVGASLKRQKKKKKERKREVVLLSPYPSLYPQMQLVQVELSIFDDKRASPPKSHRTCSLLHRATRIWQRRGRCSLWRKVKADSPSRPLWKSVTSAVREGKRDTGQAGRWGHREWLFLFPFLQCSLLPRYIAKV